MNPNARRSRWHIIVLDHTGAASYVERRGYPHYDQASRAASRRRFAYGYAIMQVPSENRAGFGMAPNCCRCPTRRKKHRTPLRTMRGRFYSTRRMARSSAKWARHKAKDRNQMLLIVGAGAVALVVYWLLKKKPAALSVAAASGA